MDPPVPRRLAVLADYACVPLAPDSAEAMHDAIVTSGDALKRWNSWWHPDSTISETSAYIDFCQAGWSAGTHFEFAVQEGEDSYVGSCALTNVDRDAGKANLSYWTRSDHAGRGIASAAARVVAAWGVGELELARIEVAMATANVASRHVAERSGAVFEGVLRNRVKVRGRHYNCALRPQPGGLPRRRADD